jgi:hypothetical protein
MTTSNHWGIYKNSLVVWYVEFPTRLRWRPAELLGFADTMSDLGGREEVLCVDEVPWTSAQDLERCTNMTTAARVSVFGRAGIEERSVRNLGAELLALRPELPHVPEVPALSVSGALCGSDPPYVTLALYTDIWFPRVIGIDGDDVRFYDNSPLAERHTPRLNRFLAGVRDAAAALGAEWSYEVNNRRYEDQVADTGIILDQSVTADRVAVWGTRICTATPTDHDDLLFELGIPGAVVPGSDGFVVKPPPPGTTELRWSEHILGFAWLETRLDDTTLTRASLDARLGPGVAVPRVHPDADFSVSYRVDVPDAPHSCVIYAKFGDYPTADTPACEVVWRRDRPRTT